MRILVLYLFLISALHCAASSVFIASEYDKRKVKESSCAIVLGLDKNSDSSLQSEVVFLKDSKDSISKHIRNNFKQKLAEVITENTVFKQIYFIRPDGEMTLRDTVVIDRRQFAMDSEKVSKRVDTIMVPVEGTKFVFSGNSPAFTLFIDKFNIVVDKDSLESERRRKAEEFFYSLRLNDGNVKQKIKISSRFFLWDNTENRLALMGCVQSIDLYSLTRIDQTHGTFSAPDMEKMIKDHIYEMFFKTYFGDFKKKFKMRN